MVQTFMPAMMKRCDGQHQRVICLLYNGCSQLIISLGASRTLRVNNGDLTIFGSARHGVQWLVEHGANVHAVDDEALRLAAKNGHVSVVQWLVEHGADVHARDDEALRCAASHGHMSV